MPPPCRLESSTPAGSAPATPTHPDPAPRSHREMAPRPDGSDRRPRPVTSPEVPGADWSRKDLAPYLQRFAVPTCRRVRPCQPRRHTRQPCRYGPGGTQPCRHVLRRTASSRGRRRPDQHEWSRRVGPGHAPATPGRGGGENRDERTQSGVSVNRGDSDGATRPRPPGLTTPAWSATGSLRGCGGNLVAPRFMLVGLRAA